MRWSKWVILLLLLLLAIAYPLARQLNQDQAGTVAGFVVDENGAPVPAATVEARNTLQGLVARAASKPDGAYRIQVTPGKYSLWAEAKGYSCAWIPQVLIEEGKNTRQDFQLTCERRDRVPVPVR